MDELIDSILHDDDEKLGQIIMQEFDLARTKTSKNTDELMDELKKKLSKKLKEFAKDERHAFAIRAEHEKEIRNMILGIVQKTWQEAANYIERATKVTPIMTEADLMKIKDNARDMEEKFWNLVGRTEQVELTTIDETSDYLDADIEETIIKVLNAATIAIAGSVQIQGATDLTFVRFVTRMDDRVCPICIRYENNVYGVFDPKPRIPEDTHLRCRCRYLIEIGGITISR